jgi:hypothetical protein
MDFITMAGLAAKYLAQSKTADNTKEQVLGSVIQWIKKKLFPKSKQLEAAVEAELPPAEKETSIKKELLAALQDEELAREFKEQMSGVMINSVDADLKDIGSVHIGNKFTGNVTGNVTNEFTGKAQNISGEFRVGNDIN